MSNNALKRNNSGTESSCNLIPVMEIKHKTLINDMDFKPAIKFWRPPKFLYGLALQALCVNNLLMLKHRDIFYFVVADSLSKLKGLRHAILGNFV